MNPMRNTIGLGARRGLIELRQLLTTGQDLVSFFLPVVIFCFVLLMSGGEVVQGVGLRVGAVLLPGVLGMSIATICLVNLVQQLVVEREDGTLLRAKATPNGMIGYLVGKVVFVAETVLITLVVQLVVGAVVTDGAVGLGGPGSWLTLGAVVVLGLAALLPIGAIAGSLVSNPRNLGLVILPLMGLAGFSGIFFPSAQLPEWLRTVTEIFPVYWLGLGCRSALLPPELAAMEIGHSWRHLETFGVLGAWAVLGMLVAPSVLRRMARRESGSVMEARRTRAMRRSG